MYLVKHSCLNLANATRELSKASNGVNPATYKELLHVIKYILDMKNLRLKIEPMGNSNEPWEIVYFSNNDYAGALVIRRSTSCFALYVLDIPVSW